MRRRPDGAVYRAKAADETLVGELGRTHRVERDGCPRAHHEYRPAGRRHRAAHLRLAGPPDQVQTDDREGDAAEDREDAVIRGIRGLLDQWIGPTPHALRVPGLLA